MPHRDLYTCMLDHYAVATRYPLDVEIVVNKVRMLLSEASSNHLEFKISVGPVWVWFVHLSNSMLFYPLLSLVSGWYYTTANYYVHFVYYCVVNTGY